MQNFPKIIPRTSSLSVSLVILSILFSASLTWRDIISKSFPVTILRLFSAFIRWFFCLFLFKNAPVLVVTMFLIFFSSLFSRIINFISIYSDNEIFGLILCFFFKSVLLITNKSLSVRSNCIPENGLLSLFEPR